MPTTVSDFEGVKAPTSPQLDQEEDLGKVPPCPNPDLPPSPDRKLAYCMPVPCGTWDLVQYSMLDLVKSLVLDKICLAILVSGPILDIGPGPM